MRDVPGSFRFVGGPAHGKMMAVSHFGVIEVAKYTGSFPAEAQIVDAHSPPLIERVQYVNYNIEIEAPNAHYQEYVYAPVGLGYEAVRQLVKQLLPFWAAQ